MDEIIHITVDDATEVITIVVVEQPVAAIELVQETLVREYASANLDGGIIN